MNEAKFDKKTSWEIIYGDYEGMQAKAVDFLSEEVGCLTTRQQGIYTLYVLPCIKGGVPKENGIVVARYGQNELIVKYVKEEEIPKDGYLVRVMDNPECKGANIVLITAFSDRNLFYGAVEFIDVYCAQYNNSPTNNRSETFDYALKEKTLVGEPKTQTRTVFTWGHPINDYRGYLKNLARLKFNQVIIWNDYVPINAKEISEFAHGYGLELIWGFAWGWIDGCGKVTDISDERLQTLKKEIVEKFEKEYAPLNPDGIYFQSFTERFDSSIGGRSIAEAVTKLVNDTSAELFKKYPKLKIQFGLHAMSVKNELEKIAKVDSRVEIVWEDGGAFPFHYEPVVKDEVAYEETLSFMEKIINLRKEGGTGILFKGYCTLDWSRFVYQAGPFVLGENHQKIIEHDTSLRLARWKYLQGQWMQYGGYAQRAAKFIEEKGNGRVLLGLAGMFDDGIWFPEAVSARMIWNADEEYADNMRITTAMPCVRMS